MASIIIKEFSKRELSEEEHIIYNISKTSTEYAIRCLNELLCKYNSILSILADSTEHNDIIHT